VQALPLLLGSEVARNMPARLSGLLIGLEIAGLAPPRSETIALVSHGDLARAYEVAFDIAGLRYSTFDAEQLACTGLFHLAKEIEKNQAAKVNS
jgi:2-keto-3-deoxy-galactonokinase